MQPSARKAAAWDFALSVIGVSAAVLTLATSLYLSGRVNTALDKLQGEQSAAQVASVLQGLDQNAQNLADYATGYAMWDDTYRFLETRDPAYEETNYAASVMAVSPVQLAAIYDLEGKLVFAAALNEGREGVPVPGALAVMPGREAVGPLQKAGDFLCRVEWLGDRAWLLAVCPVTDSAGRAPVRGYLVFGTIIGEKMLGRLQMLTGVSIEVADSAIERAGDLRVHTANLGVARVEARDQASADPEASAVFLPDQPGFPPVVLRMRLPAQALQTGRELGSTVGTAFLLVSAGFALFVALAIREMSRRAREGRELKAARDKAEELAEKAGAADQAKSAFLAMMSHEIRTPLNAIIGYADLLRENPSDSLEERLGIIVNSGGILQHILDDILDFSKIEAGKLEIDPRPTAIRRVIAETIATFQNQAESRQNQLEGHIADTVPEFLRLDDRRVTQVLSNLVSNAVKFTSDGTITVSATAVPVHPPAKGQFELRITVEDDGIGIAEGKEKTLFQPFSQADCSEARRYEGTGLGLAICRRLCTLMGGRIDFARRPERGSIFTVFLPAMAVDRPAPASRPNAVPALTGEGLGILVVDDNPVNARLLKAVLQRLGRESRIALSGEEALEAFRNTSLDVIFLDIHMPGMDGAATASRIRELEKESGRRPCVIIAVTADILADRTFNEGMDAHLRKPINAGQIEQTLTRLVEQKIG